MASNILDGIQDLAKEHKTELPSAPPDLESEKWVGLIWHALSAPIILWPPADDLFADKKHDVVVARLAKLLAHDYAERATDLEIALYCSSASLARVPGRDEFNIYMYATRRSGFAGVMDSDAMLKDEGKELDPQARYTYDNLAKWIYKQQKEELKARRKRSTQDSVSTKNN